MGDQELGANSASESANAEVAKDQIVTDTHLESEMSSPSTSLVKIYLGGLPPELDEDGLKSMLNDKNLPGAESVLVKRGGYAFLEFLDQAKADEVITLMDGESSRRATKNQTNIVYLIFFLVKLKHFLWILLVLISFKSSSVGKMPGNSTRMKPNGKNEIV